MRRSNAPVDLLVLSPHLAPPPGGVQRFAEDVANAFTDRSVRIVGVSENVDRDDRFRIVRQRKGRVGNLLTTLEYAAVAFTEVRRRPRVVQAMTWRAALPALLVRRRPPLVLFCMGGELVRNSGGKPAAALRMRVLNVSNSILAISRFTAGLVDSLTQRDATIIRPPLREMAPPAPMIEHDELVVIAVGRLVSNKGHDRLLRAVAAARQQGVSLRVVIVGGGPEEASLRALIDELALSDSARLAGAVSDAELDELYRGADMFALLSTPVAGEVEGFGIVFLEANRYGLPVIAGRSGGSEDAVADGVSGLIVANVEEAADALVQLASDAELRHRLGKQGRERLGDFTMTGFREELRAAYAAIGVVL